MRKIMFIGGPIHLETRTNDDAVFMHLGYMSGSKYWSYGKTGEFQGWELWACEGATNQCELEAHTRILDFQAIFWHNIQNRERE